MLNILNTSAGHFLFLSGDGNFTREGKDFHMVEKKKWVYVFQGEDDPFMIHLGDSNK